jgi:hypothetical protein
MLNRRPAKKRAATHSLGNIVGAAQAGAAKGGKAKARAVARKARR